MITSHLAPYIACAIKFLAGATALLAAGVAWWAAYLWLKASKVPIQVIEEPVASMSDVPELHIGVAQVRILPPRKLTPYRRPSTPAPRAGLRGLRF